MLFKAINPAAYSRFPSARSFQTTTMAMQRPVQLGLRQSYIQDNHAGKVKPKQTLKWGQQSNSGTAKRLILLCF